jgi:hypothetical protein
VLDIEAVARLRSQTLQMPLPWVFDWRRCESHRRRSRHAAVDAVPPVGGQALEMRWIDGDRCLQVLQEAAPTGVRDADPAFWLTRLDALRLANRADQFDETAIDYCVTYEVSPPSWEPARCKVRISSSAAVHAPRPTMSSSARCTSFLESGLPTTASAVAGGHGRAVGPAGGRHQRHPAQAQRPQAGRRPAGQVSCTRLIRVDFIAAGDLLNWVLSKRGENRSRAPSSTRTAWWRCSSAPWASTNTRVQVPRD